MSYVLSDSNILLRSADPQHAQHQEAEEAVKELERRGDTLCIVPQNLVEFRAVATRPLSVNGLGMSQAAVKAEIAGIRQFYVLLEETPAIFLVLQLEMWDFRQDYGIKSCLCAQM